MSNEAPPPKQFSLKDFLDALVRRRLIAIVVGIVCISVALGFALLLPPQYRSTGTILIEQQEVPVELVRSTVTAYADQRLQTINQRVMTTQNLLDLMRRYSLYPDRQKKDTREELVKRMREDVTLKMINAEVIDPRTGSPRQATIAFSVSYMSRNPEHAVKVASELTSLYLNENLTERKRLAGNTTTFLNEESERLSKQIAVTEGKLADFKLKHADAMPELQSLNRSLLDRTEQDLRASEMRAMSLEQQRVFIEAQISQVKPNSMMTTDGGERVLTSEDRLRVAKSRLSNARALYAPDHPDIGRLEREIHGLEAEVGANASPPNSANELMRDLEGAKGELAQARDRYAPDHPDVQRLERRISGLEKELAEVSANPQPTKPPVETPDNPAYIQLQTQLSATVNEQKALKARMEQSRGQMAGYERQLVTSPGIEKEYRELARDYDSAATEYRELRSKQQQAQLSQNLESDRKGERFTVIEPPLPPEKPVSPNRPAIMVLGVILALGITLAIVALLEALDTSVRGRRDLLSLLSTPPLAVLPWIETIQDRILRKRRRRVAWAGATASVLLSVTLIHLFVLPLDLVWSGVLRRLGAM
ncbi:MAG: Wzz/FepE/Etk N-terminal domain-containing protein [Gammaproteobacteria bacterium]